MDDYIVYVQIDAQGRVTAVNSSAFLPESVPAGWVQVDEGAGDRYHHAQGNYFEMPIWDERGVCRYVYLPDATEGQPKWRERTQAEMDADFVPPVAVPDPVDDLTALTVDHEYRIILMEMGVSNHDVPTV